MKTLHRVLKTASPPTPITLFTLFCIGLFWAATAPIVIHKAVLTLLPPTILAFALTAAAALVVASWRQHRLCLATAMSCDRGSESVTKDEKDMEEDLDFAERKRRRERRFVENLAIRFLLAKERGDAIEEVILIQRYPIALELVQKAKKKAGL